jgi:hypothetical protein
MFKRTMSKILTKISQKMLSVEDNSYARELSSMMNYKQIDLSSKDIDEFLNKLKDKHVINDIIITDLNGIVIGSTNKNLKEGFKSAAMYNYINTEINNLSIILIEAKGWQIIFRDKQKVYFLKANDSLTKIEVLAVVSEIEHFLKCME